MGHLKSGRVKVIGTSGKERVPYLPDVPTLAEAGVKDFNTAPWQGLLAPARTPPAIIDFLYEQIAAALKMPDVKERFASQGTDPVGLGPEGIRADDRARARAEQQGHQSSGNERRLTVTE